MAVKGTKKQTIQTYQKDKKDTGSVEVQVALLTEDIKRLTEHAKTRKHDNQSRRGLIGKVNQRRKLLSYLRDNDILRYRDLIQRLELRDSV